MSVEKDEIKKLFPGYDNIDFSVYLALLELMKQASSKEQNDQSASEQLELARIHAAKLTILFGNFKEAKAYLDSFKTDHPDARQPVHDACLFLLPKTAAEWNVPTWRSLISREKINSPNHPLMRMLPFSAKIETCAKDKTKSQVALQLGVETEMKTKFSKEYDENVRVKAIDKDEFVKNEIENSQAKIKNEVNKVFDFKIRTILGFSGKLKQEQVTTLKAKKEEAESQKLYSTVEEEVFKEFRRKVTEKYTEQTSALRNKDKATYVADKLKENADHIQNILRTKAVGFAENISVEILKLYASSVCYDRSEECPEVARLFFEWGIPEEGFNEYLSLKPKDNEKYIPKVTIKGEEICEEYKGYVLMKLDPADPYAAILGKLTGCCQFLGGQGSSCTVYGITDERAGFYVLRNPDSVIVSQCLAYRTSGNDNMVYDSVESQLNFRKKEGITVDFFTFLAKKLIKQHGVARVLVGGGGQTPRVLGSFEPINISRPNNYSGYTDAFTQRIIADKKIPFISWWIKAFPARLEKDRFVTRLVDDDMPGNVTLDKKSIQELCDLYISLCFYGDYSECIDRVRPFLPALDLSEKFVTERMNLNKEWRDLIFELSKHGSMYKDLGKFQSKAELIINKNKDININLLDNEGYPALCAVTKAASETSQNAFETIKFLVENGADVNVSARNGETALHFAVQSKDIRSVHYLIEKGANCNLRDRALGRSAFFLTKYSNDIMHYLIEKGGADINAKNDRGYTYLHWRCSDSDNDLDTIKYLLDKGADLTLTNGASRYPRTPFCEAAFYQQWKTVKYLIDYIFEKNIKINFTSVIRSATHSKNLEILNYLSQKRICSGESIGHPDIPHSYSQQVLPSEVINLISYYLPRRTALSLATTNKFFAKDPQLRQSILDKTKSAVAPLQSLKRPTKWMLPNSDFFTKNKDSKDISANELEEVYGLSYIELLAKSLSEIYGLPDNLMLALNPSGLTMSFNMPKDQQWALFTNEMKRIYGSQLKLNHDGLIFLQTLEAINHLIKAAKQTPEAVFRHAGMQLAISNTGLILVDSSLQINFNSTKEAIFIYQGIPLCCKEFIKLTSKGNINIHNVVKNGEALGFLPDYEINFPDKISCHLCCKLLGLKSDAIKAFKDEKIILDEGAIAKPEQTNNCSVM